MNWETRYMCWLYGRLLQADQLVPRRRRLIIECTRDPRHHRFSDGSDGMPTVCVPRDVSGMTTIDDAGHARELLSILDEGVAVGVEQLGWPSAPFAAAHDAVVGVDFVNRWQMKSKLSPDRKHRLQIHCDHRRREFIATLRIVDRGGTTVLEHELVRTRPTERAFVPAVDEGRWLSSSLATVYDRAGNALGEWHVPPRS